MRSSKTPLVKSPHVLAVSFGHSKGLKLTLSLGCFSPTGSYTGDPLSIWPWKGREPFNPELLAHGSFNLDGIKNIYVFIFTNP